jgi:hypothetical protein
LDKVEVIAAIVEDVATIEEDEVAATGADVEEDEVAVTGADVADTLGDELLVLSKGSGSIESL